MHNRYPVTFMVPKDTKASVCRGPGCFRRIYWIRTSRGKAMPVDTAVEGGLEPGLDRDGRGVSHWATCPAAAAFRKKRIARGQREAARR